MTTTASSREQRILELIRQNPMISQQALADRLGLSRSGVAGYIMRLQQKGQILGKGYVLPEAGCTLVVGGSNTDILGQSDNPLKMSDSNPGQIREAAGGVGRNIAENLARLGNDVKLISAVGQDSRGQSLLHQTRDSGVDISCVRQSSVLPTSSYLALSDEDGRMVAAVADMRVIDELTPELLQSHQALFLQAETLVCDCNLSEASLQWLAEHRAPESRLYIDGVSAAKVRRLRSILPYIHTLKINRDEAIELTGISQDSPGFADAVVDSLLSAGTKRILLSQGANGAMLAEQQQRVTVTPPELDIANETGAGDALMAGLVHSGSRNRTMLQQLQFAQGCAALTLSSPHANNPMLTEQLIEQWTETYL